MNFIVKSLKGLILGVISFGMLVISITSIIAVLLLGGNLREYQDLVSETVEHESAVFELTMLFKDQVHEWENVLLRGHEKASLDKYRGQFEDRHREVQDKGHILSGHLTGTREGRILDDFLLSHQDLFGQYRQGKSVFIMSDFNAQAGEQAVEGIAREPARELVELARILGAQVNSKDESIWAESKILITVSGIVIPLIALALIGLMFLVITQRFSRPLADLMVHVGRFGQGDFSVPIDIERDDEIGQIAHQLANAQKSLGVILTKVKSATEKVNDSAQNMKQNSAEISSNMQSTNSRIEQAATAVTEMAATVQEVSRNAAHAADSASRADTSAHDGAGLMQETIKTIDSLSSEVQKTSDVIRKLEDDTKNIGTVLDVIRGIAEQTNLLALNAAIEAARAGEQGRGFAVVADEVRSLAQRTQESTTEIQYIIETVQSGAKDAVTAMVHGSQATLICVEQANKAGHSLQEITSTVNDIHMMNSQIATAAEEQTTVSEDISQNINGISSLTSEVRESVAKFDDLSRSLVSMADELRQATSVIRV